MECDDEFEDAESDHREEMDDSESDNDEWDSVESSEDDVYNLEGRFLRVPR